MPLVFELDQDPLRKEFGDEKRKEADLKNNFGKIYHF